MNVFSCTNIGLSRNENQDRVKTSMLFEDVAFAVICDGMGGQNAGSEASEKAIEVIYDRVTKVFRHDYDENMIKNLLLSAVTTANAVVYDLAISSAQNHGMGTTCVMALKIRNMLHVVSVGDSRAYMVDNKIKQITKDHTMVMKMYENGEINEEELRNHPKRNYITRAVGVTEQISPDYFELNVDENATIVLCSDGLSNYCSESELLQVVNKIEEGNIAEKLVKISLDNGGNDNITVAIIK